MGAERLTTREIDREIRAVTAKAREGRSTPEELASGTFTLNNYGSFQVDGSAARGVRGAAGPCAGTVTQRSATSLR